MANTASCGNARSKRPGTLLQGIKVKDAASKRAAKAAIKARREVSGMELDADK